MASIKVRRGKSGRLVWGSGLTNLALEEYSTPHKADKIDYTTFESAGKAESTTGIEEVEWSAKGSWNAALNYYDTTPGIYPRDDGGPAKFYTNQTDAIYNSFPIVTILSTELGVQVRGKVNFTFSGCSNGPFTLATGSF